MNDPVPQAKHAPNNRDSRRQLSATCAVSAKAETGKFAVAACRPPSIVAWHHGAIATSGSRWERERWLHNALASRSWTYARASARARV